MKFDLPPAMRQATALTRAQKLPEAMRVIQNALGMSRPAEGAGDESVELSRATGAQPTAALGGAPHGSRPRFRRLAQTIEALRLGRLRAQTQARGRSPSAAPPVVDGAHFLRRSFACAQGERTYKLYLPRRPSAGLPLIVMLHGCTQTPNDFAIGTRMNGLAEEIGFVVAYPAQSRNANQSRCWNWFQSGDTQRGRGEAAIIAGITQQIVEDYGVDPHRVFVAGMSAGGAMAAILASEYPEIYAGVGIHSGLAAGSANDLVSAFAAMRGEHEGHTRTKSVRVRTIAFHGLADPTVHPSNSERIRASSRHAGDVAETTGFTSGGRSGARTVARDSEGIVWLEQWLIESAGHAWSGGDGDGSFTDAVGPDASREMVRYFLET